MICPKCGDEEEKEIALDEEAEEIMNNINDAVGTITEGKRRILEIKATYSDIEVNGYEQLLKLPELPDELFH